MKRIPVPFHVWASSGAVALGVTCLAALYLLGPGYQGTSTAGWWLAGSGLVGLAVWSLFRPRTEIDLAEGSDGTLRERAVRRDPAPPDERTIARKREDSRDKLRKTRRGPRWLRPPFTRRYGMKQPEDS